METYKLNLTGKQIQAKLNAVPDDLSTQIGQIRNNIDQLHEDLETISQNDFTELSEGVFSFKESEVKDILLHGSQTIKFSKDILLHGSNKAYRASVGDGGIILHGGAHTIVIGTDDIQNIETVGLQVKKGQNFIKLGVNDSGDIILCNNNNEVININYLYDTLMDVNARLTELETSDSNNEPAMISSVISISNTPDQRGIALFTSDSDSPDSDLCDIGNENFIGTSTINKIDNRNIITFIDANTSNSLALSSRIVLSWSNLTVDSMNMTYDKTGSSFYNINDVVDVYRSGSKINLGSQADEGNGTVTIPGSSRSLTLRLSTSNEYAFTNEFNKSTAISILCEDEYYDDSSTVLDFLNENNIQIVLKLGT